MKFESLIPKSVYSQGKHKIKLEAINNMNIFPKDNILNNKETSFKFEKESFSFSNHSQKSSKQLPSINSNKNYMLLSSDLNSTYHPTRKLSKTLERKNLFKYKTLIKKINVKKYSNYPNQSKLSNSNTHSEIDENIPTNSFFEPSYPNKLIHSKTNPNSINSHTSSSYGNSDSRFKTKICEIDNFLHKTIKGEYFTWVAGEIISEGTNSTVYKAYNQDEGKLIVVKKYNCPPGKKCENFITEVKMYEQLDHLNIIKYYSSEEIKNSYFIYLEYYSSGSLKNIIDKYGPLNETLIRKYTKQILLGLKYLHSKGIVHRDIKCANILLDTKGNVKLTDFGCSKQISLVLSDSSSNEEFCSSLKGTIPWCAPEVISLKKYGKKADIWSLGCTIIEMTGNQPWGKMDNVYQVMNTIGKTNNIPSIPDYLSEKLQNFISLCLVRDSRQRANIKTLLRHGFFGFSE